MTDMKILVEKLRGIAHDSKDAIELRRAILVLADDLESEIISDDKWDEVVSDARVMLEEYKKIPAGMFGAINIANIIARYDNGERTKELFDELLGIE